MILSKPNVSQSQPWSIWVKELSSFLEKYQIYFSRQFLIIFAREKIYILNWESFLSEKSQFTFWIIKSGGYGFPLSGNAARVQSAVQNLEYLLGNTRTGEALDYAKTNVLRRARPGASQVNYFIWFQIGLESILYHATSSFWVTVMLVT